jgi:hypothetical protein
LAAHTSSSAVTSCWLSIVNLATPCGALTMYSARSLVHELHTHTHTHAHTCTLSVSRWYRRSNTIKKKFKVVYRKEEIQNTLQERRTTR